MEIQNWSSAQQPTYLRTADHRPKHVVIKTVNDEVRLKTVLHCTGIVCASYLAVNIKHSTFTANWYTSFVLSHFTSLRGKINDSRPTVGLM